MMGRRGAGEGRIGALLDAGLLRHAADQLFDAWSRPTLVRDRYTVCVAVSALNSRTVSSVGERLNSLRRAPTQSWN